MKKLIERYFCFWRFVLQHEHGKVIFRAIWDILCGVWFTWGCIWFGADVAKRGVPMWVVFVGTFIGLVLSEIVSVFLFKSFIMDFGISGFFDGLQAEFDELNAG